MNAYRRCNVFERILSLSTVSTLPDTCLDLTIELLLRCTFVDGSTTLITRCGIDSWTTLFLRKKGGILRDKLLHLAARVIDTSDRDQIKKWSDGGLDPVWLDIRHKSNF